MKTIRLPANSEFISFDKDVGRLISIAEYPDEAMLSARMLHDWRIGESLLNAVRQGRLRVRDCQTRFPLRPDAPSVDVLLSLVSVNDFREFVADLGYEIKVVEAEKKVNQTTKESPAPSNISEALILSEEAEIAEGTSTTEPPEARQDRRLFRLRELGANFVPHGEGWRVSGRRGALADLIKEEKAAGRPMSDKTDIRKDLKAAAEREREGKLLAV